MSPGSRNYKSCLLVSNTLLFPPSSWLSMALPQRERPSSLSPLLLQSEKEHAQGPSSEVVSSLAHLLDNSSRQRPCTLLPKQSLCPKTTLDILFTAAQAALLLHISSPGSLWVSPLSESSLDCNVLTFNPPCTRDSRVSLHLFVLKSF